jgi:hypothetical protein
MGTLSRPRRRRDDVSYAAGDIAETRHDMSTQDIRSDGYTSGDYDDEDDDGEKSPQSPSLIPSLVAPLRNQNESRFARLGVPLHAHAMNSSTFLASDAGSSTQAPCQDSEKSGTITRAINFAHNPRTMSSTNSKSGPGFTNTTSLEPRTFSPEMENNLESQHYPGEETEADQSGKGFGGKFGSIWRRKKQSQKSETFSYGDVDRGNVFSGSQIRRKSKERHPLDHHYEMDTIHSQALNDSNYEYDEEESPER